MLWAKIERDACRGIVLQIVPFSIRISKNSWLVNSISNVTGRLTDLLSEMTDSARFTLDDMIGALTVSTRVRTRMVPVFFTEETQRY